MKIAYASALDSFDRIVRIWQILHYSETSHHNFAIIGSGRAFAAVEERYPDSFGIHYPRVSNPKERDELMWKNNGNLISRLKNFRPDVMLLDGEAFAAQIAEQLQIPIISIDPYHLFQFSRIGLNLPPHQLQQLLDEKENLRKRPYQAWRYILPSFINGAIYSKRARFSQPLIRHEVSSSPKLDGDKFLAYLPPHVYSEIPILESIEYPIVTHIAMRKYREKREQVLWEQEIEGGEGILRRRKQSLPSMIEQSELTIQLPPSTPYLTHKVASPEEWIPDLLSCRAVICDGNHTTIAEAITAQKPMLIIPKPDDFPQWCYSQYIEKIGVGECHPRLSRAIIEGFIMRIDRYREKLASLQNPSPQFFDLLELAMKSLPSH